MAVAIFRFNVPCYTAQCTAFYQGIFRWDLVEFMLICLGGILGRWPYCFCSSAYVTSRNSMLAYWHQMISLPPACCPSRTREKVTFQFYSTELKPDWQRCSVCLGCVVGGGERVCRVTSVFWGGVRWSVLALLWELTSMSGSFLCKLSMNCSLGESWRHQDNRNILESFTKDISAVSSVIPAFKSSGLMVDV